MKKKKSDADSLEFLEKEKIIKLQTRFEENRHQMRMKELVYVRETEGLKHDMEKERNRIKSAEIRRAQQRSAEMRDKR